MNDAKESIRNITPEGLAGIGAPSLAYVRPVEAENGQKLFGIFSANGMQMGVAPSRELAFITVRQHEMFPVSVH
jgi:hypothetical protein